MTTTTHPAHGPVSLDRLHQIREHLQHDTQYSNGGNRAYILADVLKVIDGAIAAFGAEPVGTFKKGPCGYYSSFHEDAVPLYTAPQPAPVVPPAIEPDYEVIKAILPTSNPDEYACCIAADMWNACRAAMLHAGNSPVTPDRWIPVSERMPERDVDVQVYCADKKEQMVGYMERNEAEGWFRFASLPNGVGVYCKPTHWMPLPAAPQQEVKSALEHGMQRYAGAMQKLSEGDE
ncbi:DUF551 domain-containing protein [Salmonella enterica]|jgi:hypothetical protein